MQRFVIDGRISQRRSLYRHGMQMVCALHCHGSPLMFYRRYLTEITAAVVMLGALAFVPNAQAGLHSNAHAEARTTTARNPSFDEGMKSPLRH